MERLRKLKRRVMQSRLWPFARPQAAPVTRLNARDGYRLWAPAYASETATSFLDEELARAMLRGLPRTVLLDAGCGTGRRIANVFGAVGLDASPEMLAAGGARNLVKGDVRSMPFASNSFDMVWCRLVLGHLPDPLPAYRELARVCVPGGHVFVTDFHPDAAAAGHKRTFTSQSGSVYEVEHYMHEAHPQLAAQAGLTLVAHCEGVVGPSIRSFYTRGLGERAYRRDKGLKLVTAYLYQKRNND